jgi:Flp pilus assembly protein TadG
MFQLRPTMRASRLSAVRRREDGAAAVEFAMVLPILVIIVLGIVTGGMSYSNAIGVQNAVREGARFGATGDVTQLTWAGDVISRVRSTQFDDGTTAADSGTSVCVQLFKAPSTVSAWECSIGQDDGPPLTPPASPTDRPSVPADLAPGACVVRVVAARKFEINGGLASWDGTIVRASTALYERTCP